MTTPTTRAIALAAGAAATGPGYYKGVSIRETAGAAATVRIFDNTAASGLLVGTYALAANASLDVCLPSAVWFATGLYVAVTGTVEGSVRVG